MARCHSVFTRLEVLTEYRYAIIVLDTVGGKGHTEHINIQLPTLNAQLSSVREKRTEKYRLGRPVVDVECAVGRPSHNGGRSGTQKHVFLRNEPELSRCDL